MIFTETNATYDAVGKEAVVTFSKTPDADLASYQLRAVPLDHDAGS